MSVSKRRSEAIWIEKRRYWQVKVQRDGVRKAFTSSTPGRRGKHEAEAKADEWLESQTEDIRFFPAWDAYLADVKARCGTSHYGNVERNGRLHIKPVIKNVKLCSITVAAWKNCLQAAANAGLARASCASIRASITSFVEFAEDHRWRIESLPVRKLAIPRKAAPPKPKQALQPKDIRTLFTVSEVTLYGKPQPAFFIHAYRFMVATGLRRGELCGLRWEDYDGVTICIRRSINRFQEETHGKNDNAVRSFQPCKIAQEVLARQREALKSAGITSPWIFPDEYGERLNPNHLYDSWRVYRRQHGLCATLHELRHTFISLNKNDMPLELLKGVVGHSIQTDTTGIYGHEIEGEKARAAKIIDSVFGKILN